MLGMVNSYAVARPRNKLIKPRPNSSAAYNPRLGTTVPITASYPIVIDVNGVKVIK